MRLRDFLGPGKWPLVLSVLVLVLALGCSDDGVTSNAVEFSRLQLEPTGAQIEFPKAAVLQRWENFREQGSDHDNWSIDGGAATLWTYQKQRVLRVDRSKRPVTILIPVDIDLDSHPTVDLLSVLLGAKMNITVALLRGQKQIAVESQQVTGSKEMRGHSFPLAGTLRTSGKVDTLRITFSKGKEPFAIRSLSVKESPPGTDLGAGAFGSSSLVEIQGDARRATALPSGSQLKASFDVGAAQDVLRFSYGQPDSLQIKGQDCALVVRLSTQSGASAERRLSLRGAFGKDNRWQHAEMALEPFAEQTLELSLELESSDGDAMCVLGQPRRTARAASAPTVLLVTSDTHRRDHLGFLTKDGKLRTDAIDKLASQGLVFLDAVSSVNNTTPSHVSLMTGMTPRDTGLVANAKRLADAAPTLAEAFRDIGFATLASVSASPVNYKFCNLGQGFDRYGIPANKSVHDSSITIQRMLDWLEEYKGSPVFAWVHVYDAHGPYDPPDELTQMYYESDKDPLDPDAEGADLSVAPYWNRKIADPDYTEALYDGEITYLDEGLSRLFELPRVRDGIMVLTADHGEVLRYGPDASFDHRGLSLNTLAVPLIFKAPGLVPGERRTDPVLQIDVGRTLLNLAGYPGADFPGRDLIGTTLEPGEPRFAIQANGISASVLTDKWMLDMNLRIPARGRRPRDEVFHAIRLYDIVNDPFCRYNVWEEHSKTSKSLRRLLIRWLGRAENNHWQTEDVLGAEEIEQHLANLGYVSVEDSTDATWFDPTCDCKWCQKFDE